MKTLIDIFLTFAKIGGFTFGGGYAMLPMIQREIVEKKKWASLDDIMTYYAVSQCTPGVIAVNTATFVGKKVKGIIGAIVATLGVITPSVIIITIIAAFIRNFLEYEVVSYALGGINVVVAVLILNSIITLFKKGVKNTFGFIIFILSMLFSIFTDFSPVIVVVISIISGIVYGKIKRGKVEEK